MSPIRLSVPMSPAALAGLARVAHEGGQRIREERLRRAWSLRDLADRAGVGPSLVHKAENGQVVSLGSYARLAAALGLRLSLLLDSTRGRPRHNRDDAEDFVHAAMGELEARALARPGRSVSIDEPYQHYQFAGRADVLAWDRDNLLHVENRTRFPTLQEAAGAYNAKRRYLAPALADRLGVGPRGWRSVTHVMACLWSSEMLHLLRLRPATFSAMCPDPADAFLAWLAGTEPPAGVTSTLVVLDPLVPFGSRRRTIAALADLPRLGPRYRGYAGAAEALR